MGRAFSTDGEESHYKVLVGKPEGKRLRWEDNIKMDTGGIRCRVDSNCLSTRFTGRLL
jgi:hypothetical protein